MAQSKKAQTARTRRQIGALAGVGKAVPLAVVDFSDPNRPKSCLEVDFPILPINQVATLEGNAAKPIYQMSKWWARRRSSVFRSLLIAGATRAPEDQQQAAQLVWDAYYANHQRLNSFAQLKVADIFMGGGTTLVEGARLGMQIVGNDLNPVAWLVVKNQFAPVTRKEVEALLRAIEDAVKPQIMPFYATTCPRGHQQKWIERDSGRIVAGPLPVRDAARGRYRYKGPEIIYTFWAKHGTCQAEGCGHRTPILTSAVVTEKEISVRAWKVTCACGATITVERGCARLAPGAPLFVAPTEQAFAALDEEGRFTCPQCAQPQPAPQVGGFNTKVRLTLLVHPQWMKGLPSTDEGGQRYGGSATDGLESTKRWNGARAVTLRLLEVRGELPDSVTCPETGLSFNPGAGTVPKRSAFTCHEPTCGRENDILDSVKATSRTGPVAAFAQQCYCPECDANGQPYGGRYFQLPDLTAFDAAHEEWLSRKDTDLAGLWPTSELPYGFMTHHLQGGVPNHGYTHWWTMFNPRQLLVHACLLNAVLNSGEARWEAREIVLGAFQQYLRNQNMFCIWNIQGDKLEPLFSNNHYHPRSTVVENCVFPPLGRGNWASCAEGVVEGVAWCRDPWDTLAKSQVRARDERLADEITGKSAKVRPGDAVLPNAGLYCGSSTELRVLGDGSQDMVITDPPFGDLLHYSELSDFFYVWLRLALRGKYPELFGPQFTPKTLEAVSNKARQPKDPDAFYQRLLTACWSEAHRILKPGGTLAFTFHHSEAEPWIAVLDSLFTAGFYLEATYPIRSDETKGDGEFGSKTIEFDIIHVCRKRAGDPTPISWARLRRRIIADVRELESLLRRHQASGLSPADLQVIRRGKALEHFSRHYGCVYVEKGREFTLPEALNGIRQLLDDELDSDAVAPPVAAEVYTRQFLRIFDGVLQVDRNDIVKHLRGTGVAASLFEANGWCRDERRAYHFCDPLQFARSWRGKARKGTSRDLDQTLFLVGACCADSGIRVAEMLGNPSFEPHPAVPDLLDWLARRGGSETLRGAAGVAGQLYSKWLGDNQPRAAEARRQFDLET